MTPATKAVFSQWMRWKYLAGRTIIIVGAVQLVLTVGVDHICLAATPVPDQGLTGCNLKLAVVLELPEE